jgi:hypothetical protein
MRFILVVIISVFAWSCSLFPSGDLPAEVIDLQLLDENPTAAAKDLLRRTPTYRIEPDDVAKDVTFAVSDTRIGLGLLQQFKGIGVEGGQATFDVDKRNGETRLTDRSRWRAIASSTSTEPSITADSATAIAKAEYPYPLREPETVFYDGLTLTEYQAPFLRFYSVAGEGTKLTWFVNVYGMNDGDADRRLCVIHAHTGQILAMGMNLVCITDRTSGG